MCYIICLLHIRAIEGCSMERCQLLGGECDSMHKVGLQHDFTVRRTSFCSRSTAALS